MYCVHALEMRGARPGPGASVPVGGRGRVRRNRRRPSSSSLVTRQGRLRSNCCSSRAIHPSAGWRALVLAPNPHRVMRIFTACFGTETNTFAPIPTDRCAHGTNPACRQEGAAGCDVSVSYLRRPPRPSRPSPVAPLARSPAGSRAYGPQKLLLSAVHGGAGPVERDESSAAGHSSC